MLKLAFLSLFLAFFAVAAHAQQPSPRPAALITTAQNDQNSSKTDALGSESAPFIVKILPPEIPSNAANQPRDQEHRAAALDLWIIVPTWLLAVFTGLLFWFTFKLWRSTAALVKDSKTSAELQSRAYLGIVRGSVALGPQGTFVIEIVVSNGGRTPAHDVEHCIDAGFRNAEEEHTGPMPALRPHKQAMTPMSHLTIRHQIANPQEQLPVEAGTRTIIFWGRVTYKDVFQNRQRELKFCYRKAMDHQPLRQSDQAAGITLRWDAEPTVDGNVST